MRVCSITLLLFAFAQGARGLATFPYENEDFIPVDFTAATPDYTYDENDSGGYMWTYTYSLDYMTDLTLPYCSSGGGCLQLAFYVNFGAAEMPAELWNCTYTYGTIFKHSDFTGTINTEKICEPGSCCEELIGLNKYEDDSLAYHAWLADVSSAGLCRENLYEALYCALVDGHYRSNCFERVISYTDRQITFPCPDTFQRYFLSCPVLVASVPYFSFQIESKTYEDLQTGEQRLLLEIAGNNNDFVCHPYSYYFPSSSGDKASTVSTVSSASIFSIVVTAALYAL